MFSFWRLFGVCMILLSIHSLIARVHGDEFWYTFWIGWDIFWLGAWTIIVTFHGDKK